MGKVIVKRIKTTLIVVFALGILTVVPSLIRLIDNSIVSGDVHFSVINNEVLNSSYVSSNLVPLTYKYKTGKVWEDTEFSVNYFWLPLVRADSKSNLHIFVWSRGSIRHLFRNGTMWIFEGVDKASYHEPHDANLDSRDYSHIVYSMGGQLRYAYFNGSSWIIQNVTTYGAYASISLDSKDNPHVCYFDSGLKYASFDGSSWKIQTIDNNATYTKCQASISVDSNDNPHIAYSAGLTSQIQSLKYAYFNGTSWNIETVDGEGYYVSMALDSYNYPHVSYRNGTIVKYAHFNGTSWSVEVIDNANPAKSGLEFWRTSLALNSRNIPHILYKYEEGARLVYYYGKQWIVQNLGKWQQSPSLAVDPEDNLHISYACFVRYWWYLCYLFYKMVFLTNFSLNDDSGNPLYKQSGQIKALAPDGKLVTFKSFSNQYLDKGNWTLKDVIWQGNKITPQGNITYTSTPGGTWVINNTRVYALKIKLKDQFGNQFSQGVTMTFPNKTTKIKNPTSGWINMTQVQNGTITIKTPICFYPSERYSLLNSTSISLTENTMIDSLVWLYETTTLTISCSPSTTYVGFKVDITGKLTNSLTGGISGVTIVLNYQVPGVPTWNLIQSVTTKADGTFSVIWIPTATGYYLIEARWDGNDNWPPGAYNTVNLAITPYSDEYIFSVESNSTVSSLVFNSTSRELSFTLSGPTGTYGYVDIIIAKSLIANVADIRVYLNGTQTDYTVTSADNSWRLHFTYHHSTYKLIVRLGPTPFIPLQLVTPLTIGTLTIILIIATVIAILRIRKRAPSTILDSAFR